MSNFFKGFLNGIFGSEGYLRNQQHASRLYHEDGFYNYAPKAGWLYYVVLNINPDYAVQREITKKWGNRYQRMVGILAKTVQLPGFKIATETMNQYNRKTVVQTKLTYDPVTIEFHDDHANVTNDLWRNYYQYYYADSAYEAKKQLRTGNVGTFNPSFEDTKTGFRHYKYGFNKPHEIPFFNQIEIYQLNRQEYNGMRLINPIVTSWQHGQLNQSQNSFLESKMTVAYESVVYTSGLIKTDLNITENHYDTTPSPVRPGGIFGALSGASDVFGTLQDFGAGGSPLDLIKAGIQVTQVAKTVKNLNTDSIAQEGYSVLAGGLSAVARGGRPENTGAAVDRFVGGLGGANAVNLFKNFENNSVQNITKAETWRPIGQRFTSGTNTPGATNL